MELKTERLYIRRVLARDRLDLKRIFEDFQRSSYAVYDAPLPTEEGAVTALAEQFADSELCFAVFLASSPTMIGYICFHDVQGSYDLGYCFHSDYWGNGYALEACSAMLAYMQQRYNVQRFTAGTALQNVPSCNLLKKLGFTLQETEQLSFHKDKSGKDIVFEGGVFVKCCT